MIFFSLTTIDLHKCRGKSPMDEILDWEKAAHAHALVESLPVNEREAVAARFGLDEAPSVSDLARAWRCSRQRVYEIAARGLTRLRNRRTQKEINECH
jgi:DNA-directed RNA polymerase sigma subunit (sigma70/sigma32)